MLEVFLFIVAVALTFVAVFAFSALFSIITAMIVGWWHGWSVTFNIYHGWMVYEPKKKKDAWSLVYVTDEFHDLIMWLQFKSKRRKNK